MKTITRTTVTMSEEDIRAACAYYVESRGYSGRVVRTALQIVERTVGVGVGERTEHGVNVVVEVER